MTTYEIEVTTDVVKTGKPSQTFKDVSSFGINPVTGKLAIIRTAEHDYGGTERVWTFNDGSWFSIHVEANR